MRSGISIRATARVLNRSPSTISRELKRNLRAGKYKPIYADNKAFIRRKHIHKRYKISGALRSKVAYYLAQQWSPEQISGRLALAGIKFSHETVYQFIYREFRLGNKIYLNCRRRRKYRRTRQATRNYKNKANKRNFPNIKDRPSIVNERIRIGDYERDMIVGKHGKACLLTIVDRVTKQIKIGKLAKINALDTHHLTIRLLERHPVHTITNDNGTEFFAYKLTQEALNTSIYFNDPYSSWQRGTNENINGLVRQYFPKGTNFDEISQDQIAMVEERLNNRPRKNLGYKTPIEYKNSLSQSVALSC